MKNIKSFSKVSQYFINFYYKNVIVKTANIRSTTVTEPNYTEEYCVALVILRFVHLL